MVFAQIANAMQIEAWHDKFGHFHPIQEKKDKLSRLLI